eukprot:TRINITY_DN681_c0_g1_i4.p1 TRINITY_DN681_c0_g1~~TRINITY_DN681_c0_g1_i4.p1  ORF type:complete len:111 (-),score=9.42 TRINITY_DN681_c0_g1_i4:580-912(-)
MSTPTQNQQRDRTTQTTPKSRYRIKKKPPPPTHTTSPPPHAPHTENPTKTEHTQTKPDVTSPSNTPSPSGRKRRYVLKKPHQSLAFARNPKKKGIFLTWKVKKKCILFVN